MPSKPNGCVFFNNNYVPTLKGQLTDHRDPDSS